VDNQTYQELIQVILKELKDSRPDFKEVEPQDYFYNLKLKYPEKYKELTFNVKTKTQAPFSRDLSAIFSHLRDCGFLGLDNNILFE
jgi:hypothetical protein